MQNGLIYMVTIEKLNSHKQNITGGGKQIVFLTNFGWQKTIMVSISTCTAITLEWQNFAQKYLNHHFINIWSNNLRFGSILGGRPLRSRRFSKYSFFNETWERLTLSKLWYHMSRNVPQTNQLQRWPQKGKERKDFLIGFEYGNEMASCVAGLGNECNFVTCAVFSCILFHFCCTEIWNTAVKIRF